MYREHRCSEGLRPYVECYWSRGEAKAKTTRVVPDGCADILFPEGKPPFVVGTMTRPLLVDGAASAPIIAVLFRPGGAYPFFSVPIRELTDVRADLGDVWRHPESVETLADLDSVLLSRISRVPKPDARIAEAVERIEETRGRVRVDRLSDALGCSRQHMNRLFERHVGVGVKLFSRIVRLRSAIGRLPVAGWADFALDAGYCDQSHFISECRALTGVTPLQLGSESSPG